MELNSVAKEQHRASSGLPLRRSMLISFGSLVLATFLITNLVRTYGIPFTRYDGTYGDRVSEVLSKLDLVADIKKERFLLWLEERRFDAESLARDRFIMSHIPELHKAMLQSLEHGEDMNALRTQLLGLKDYQAILERFQLTKETHC